MCQYRNLFWGGMAEELGNKSPGWRWVAQKTIRTIAIRNPNTHNAMKPGGILPNVSVEGAKARGGVTKDL
jgi:hypothetical protein